MRTRIRSLPNLLPTRQQTDHLNFFNLKRIEWPRGAFAALQSTEDMDMGYKIAVIGATGNVGREMMNVLAEREFPVDEVFAVASRRSIGTEVSFGEKTLKCHSLDSFDFFSFGSTCG